MLDAHLCFEGSITPTLNIFSISLRDNYRSLWPDRKGSAKPALRPLRLMPCSVTVIFQSWPSHMAECLDKIARIPVFCFNSTSSNGMSDIDLDFRLRVKIDVYYSASIGLFLSATWWAVVSGLSRAVFAALRA